MKILFVNNRDSFVWNLVDYVSMYESDTVVVPNTISVNDVCDIGPDAIVISPGPGNPENSRDIGSCLDIIKEFGPTIPILGVCLGHQSINVTYGGTIGHSPDGPVHGKTAMILHDGSDLFAGLSEKFAAGRYHSLSIHDLATDVDVIAKNDDGIIMGIKHSKYPVYGVQFHPESILTPEGMKLVGNFLKIAGMGTKV